MGAGASVPETLDQEKVKSMAGDKFDADQFDSLQVEGVITRDQWEEVAKEAKDALLDEAWDESDDDEDNTIPKKDVKDALLEEAWDDEGGDEVSKTQGQEIEQKDAQTVRTDKNVASEGGQEIEKKKATPAEATAGIQKENGQGTEAQTVSAPVKSILVIIAMDAEAKPFLEKMALPKRTDLKYPGLAIDTHQGVVTLGEHTVQLTVVTNGKCGKFGVDNVGTTPAALTAYLALQSLRESTGEPDLIINAGTAGGFQRKGGEVGDVYLGTHCRHHDRRIGIPGFTEYGIGNHAALETPNLLEHLGAKRGAVTTGNSLEHTERDSEMMLANDACVKEMEASAIAWVAEQVRIPMIAIKVVTDIVDGDRPSNEEFLGNLSKAAMTLQTALPKAVEFIAGKRLSEL
jgi:5'-methylthioadenosine nucleosidase